MTSKREYGDYQTPFNFALKICTFLKEEKNLKPEIILDPTCGIGNFLKASKIFEAEKYFGVEINPNHCKECIKNFSDERLNVINEDFFQCDLSILSKDDNLLIIGNPPWATNSNLSRNLPKKSNFKNLKGLDALTGASNFDICEYIISNLVERYRNTKTVFAMLCKNSVARKIFANMINQRICFESFEIFEFDSKKIFGISASACLSFIRLTDKNFSLSNFEIYDLENPNILKKSLSFENGNFSCNTSDELYDFDGKCNFEWRQGIKHDCSKIMELTLENGNLKNGNNEVVAAEDKIIFPLIKGSTIKNPIVNKFSKYVIVTQKFLGEDTAHLENDAPLTWQYLKKNSALLAKRKSRIYDNATEFAMFGIGDYSYLPYKVCIGGFNKKPVFSLAFSLDKKPVMLDDTSYFIGFENYEMAYVAMIYLNSAKVQGFLQDLSFTDAKRPYTKKLLSRLDFSKICKKISIEELKNTESELGLENQLNESALKNFLELLKPIEQQLL